MPADNKLELVVEVDVNKANASIKSIDAGLPSMEQVEGVLSPLLMEESFRTHFERYIRAAEKDPIRVLKNRDCRSARRSAISRSSSRRFSSFPPLAT